jgi:DNA topoisomerase-3
MEPSVAEGPSSCEKRLTTYPRTDSQYITHDDLETLRALTTGVERVDGFVDPDVLPSAPRLDLVVDDAQVAGHTAVLPTRSADKAALDGLTEDERLVLTRVVRRMWEAVSDDHVHDTTLVVANLDTDWCERHPDEGRRLPEAETRFTCRSDQPVSQGWKAIEPKKDDTDKEDAASERNVIPANLVHGVALKPVDKATMAEGKTQPTKPFTESTLLNAMEHASRYVEDKTLKAALDDDESHSGGIGTPATRADVLEKLVRSGYLARKGKQIRSTDAGRALVDVVSSRLKDVALTADMERSLSDVEHGKADAATVYAEFRDLAARIPADAQTTVQKDHVQARTRNTESFGDCPRCGKPVVKTGKVFQCSTNRREKQPDGTWKTTEGCGWRAWTTIAGKTVTDTTMRRLLDGRKVSLKGFTSKKGSKFDAALVIDKDKGVAFDFGDNNKERKRK